jgi:hypothetical protein
MTWLFQHCSLIKHSVYAVLKQFSSPKFGFKMTICLHRNWSLPVVLQAPRSYWNNFIYMVFFHLKFIHSCQL